MQRRLRGAVRSRLVAGVALAAFALTARAQPAAGDAGRIRVEVDGWWAVARNLDLDYAFVEAGAGLSGGGEVAAVGTAREWVPALRLGWQFARRGKPMLAARLWQLETDASDATGTVPQRIGALLAAPDFAIGRSLVDSASAALDMRATLTDVAVSWQLGDDADAPAHVGFAVGVRVFRYEGSTAVIYRNEPFGTLEEEFVTSDSDAAGVGPMLAASFGYRFGRRTTVHGRVALALPVGEHEGRVTDTALVDGQVDRIARADAATTRHAFLQSEATLGVTVRVGRVDLTAGYRFAHWPDVQLEQRFVDDVAQNATVPVEREVVFEGPMLGLGVSF